MKMAKKTLGDTFIAAHCRVELWCVDPRAWGRRQGWVLEHRRLEATRTWWTWHWLCSHQRFNHPSNTWHRSTHHQASCRRHDEELGHQDLRRHRYLYSFTLFLLPTPNEDGHIYLRQVNGVNGGDRFRLMCVCVCVCVQRTGQSDHLKRLKLRTSKLTCMFPGTVRTCPLKIFRKGGVARVS